MHIGSNFTKNKEGYSTRLVIIISYTGQKVYKILKFKVTPFDISLRLIILIYMYHYGSSLVIYTVKVVQIELLTFYCQALRKVVYVVVFLNETGEKSAELQNILKTLKTSIAASQLNQICLALLLKSSFFSIFAILFSTRD